MPQPDHISVLGVPDPAMLDDDLKAIWAKCVEKLGFVPNVYATYSLKPQRLRNFMAMYNEIMLSTSGLTKLERERIAVVDDGDRDGLRALGLSNDDLFDLAETTAFVNLSNRMASASDMMPNKEYHPAFR